VSGTANGQRMALAAERTSDDVHPHYIIRRFDRRSQMANWHKLGFRNRPQTTWQPPLPNFAFFQSTPQTNDQNLECNIAVLAGWERTGMSRFE